MISKLSDNNIYKSTLETQITNRVTGKLPNGETETSYFLQTHKLKAFHKKLEKLQMLVNDIPFFPLPIFGISTRLEKTGLSKIELMQVSTLFRAEMEAYLLEIWSHICPTMSALIFRRDRDNIWRMQMDLWKETLDEDLHPTFQNITFSHDTPPHITKRKPRRTTHFELEVGTIEEVQENESQFDNSRTSIQNLYTNIASQHVGTQAFDPPEPDI